MAEEVENYLAEDSEKGIKKALGLMKKMAGFSPEDRGVELSRSLLEILSGNKSEGRKMLATAWKRVQEIGSDNLKFEEMTYDKCRKYASKFSAAKTSSLISCIIR